MKGGTRWLRAYVHFEYDDGCLHTFDDLHWVTILHELLHSVRCKNALLTVVPPYNSVATTECQIPLKTARKPSLEIPALMKGHTIKSKVQCSMQ